MSENHSAKTKPDRWVYVENRRKFPREEQRKYAGQWLAWSADGSRIVAHHEDLQQVVRIVDEAGIDREDVIFDWEPEEDVDTLL